MEQESLLPSGSPLRPTSPPKTRPQTARAQTNKKLSPSPYSAVPLYQGKMVARQNMVRQFFLCVSPNKLHSLVHFFFFLKDNILKIYFKRFHENLIKLNTKSFSLHYFWGISYR